MPVATFPASLPAPQLRSYSRKLFTAQGKQQFINQVRYYRRTRGSPVIDNVTFRCTKQQRETLWQFYRNQGGAGFEILLPCGRERVPQQARFHGQLTEVCNGKTWDLTVELVIPSPPLIPAGELDSKFLTFMNIKDGSFADPLNEFVHTDWPTYDNI